MGAHRDPITSEKSWLDFAVRELSRVAAGKAGGQEAVWHSQCKPAWWDCVRLPWKNPTANPKDSKDTLKNKFECLVQHLRKEGKVPCEIKEEIALWEKGRMSEVFLMTTFSSLLGQASNLHSLLGDSCHKMEDTGISIAPSILTDLEKCLSACQDKVKTMKSLATQRQQNSPACGVAQAESCSGRKHLHDGSDVGPPSKRPKFSSSLSSNLSPISSSSSSSSSSPSQSQSPGFVRPVSNSDDPPNHPEQQKLVLAAPQKQLLQRKMAETAAALPIVQHSHKTTPLSVRRRAVPSTTQSRQLVEKEPVHVLNQGSVAAVADASTTPQVSLPATAFEHTVPETMSENLESSLNLLWDYNTGDFELFDRLLEEISPDVGISTSSPAVASEGDSLGSLSSVETMCESLLKFQTTPAHNESTNRASPDPFLCHSVAATEVPPTSPFQLGVTVEAEAGRHLGNEAAATSDNFGTTLSADAGDKVLNESEIVSDLGYSSEGSSPTPQRSSLDSNEFYHADISSPDLEAFLGMV